eukprot:scaffold38124_cov74-Phaeocystis_antarctica.AAC.4
MWILWKIQYSLAGLKDSHSTSSVPSQVRSTPLVPGGLRSVGRGYKHVRGGTRAVGQLLEALRRSSGAACLDHARGPRLRRTPSGGRRWPRRLHPSSPLLVLGVGRLELAALLARAQAALHVRSAGVVGADGEDLGGRRGDVALTQGLAPRADERVETGVRLAHAVVVARVSGEGLDAIVPRAVRERQVARPDEKGLEALLLQHGGDVLERVERQGQALPGPDHAPERGVVLKLNQVDQVARPPVGVLAAPRLQQLLHTLQHQAIHALGADPDEHALRRAVDAPEGRGQLGLQDRVHRGRPAQAACLAAGALAEGGLHHAHVDLVGRPARRARRGFDDGEARSWRVRPPAHRRALACQRAQKLAHKVAVAPARLQPVLHQLGIRLDEDVITRQVPLQHVLGGFAGRRTHVQEEVERVVGACAGRVVSAAKQVGAAEAVVDRPDVLARQEGEVVRRAPLRALVFAAASAEGSSRRCVLRLLWQRSQRQAVLVWHARCEPERLGLQRRVGAHAFACPRWLAPKARSRGIQRGHGFCVRASGLSSVQATPLRQHCPCRSVVGGGGGGDAG